MRTSRRPRRSGRRARGVLCVFWHSRIGLSPSCWPLDRAQPAKALISLSADGEFIAKAVARQGFPAVRGSSANKDKAAAAKGGSQALRDGLKQLKLGALAITPDGPRGPANVMAEGLPLMAKLSRAPVLFIGMSCSPAIRLNSWDKAVLPLPFGKGAIVWDRADYPEGGRDRRGRRRLDPAPERRRGAGRSDHRPEAVRTQP